MQRWEYLTLASTRNYGTTKYYVNGQMQPNLKNQELSAVMNQIGQQGWEMVGIAADKDGQTFIFKRAATGQPAPQPKPRQPAAVPTPAE